MDLFIHYTALPEGKMLKDVITQLSDVLEEHGEVCGGETTGNRHRLDLQLEDERMNPKFAQMAVKTYLQRAQFPKDTTIEIGAMEIGIYE